MNAEKLAVVFVVWCMGTATIILAVYGVIELVG